MNLFIATGIERFESVLQLTKKARAECIYLERAGATWSALFGGRRRAIS